MKIGTEDKKKLAVLGVVGAMALGAGVYLYTQLSEPALRRWLLRLLRRRLLTPVVKSSGSGGGEEVGTTRRSLIRR